MDVAQLTLNSLAFEVRYAPAYLIWDRAGQIWADAVRRWPDFKPKDASPVTTRFWLSNRVEMLFQVQQAHVISVGPKIDLDEYISFCNSLIEQASGTLEVTSFTRIGLRHTFVKSFDTVNEASDAVLRTRILNFPGGKHFGIEGRINNPDINFRIEDEHNGCSGRILSQSKKIAVEVPLGEDIGVNDTERHEFIFDCDYYTRADTLVGQFRAADWIRQAVRVVRRDAKVFLGS